MNSKPILEFKDNWPDEDNWVKQELDKTMSPENFKKQYLNTFEPDAEIITLQYFNGREWIDCGNWQEERLAWISLGGDDMNYRTIIKSRNHVLTDKSV